MPRLMLPVTHAPALLLTMLCACTTPPPAPDPLPEPVWIEPLPVVEVKADPAAMLPLIDYVQSVQAMSASALTRERTLLVAMQPTPANRVRLAIALGFGRAPHELNRALAVLDDVQKSATPEAASLHPLVRLLAAQYQERTRLELERGRLQQQIERHGPQLKEVQRQTEVLQEKLDALADIERATPARSSANRGKPAGVTEP